MAEVKNQLTSDHHELYDTLTARRYFAKFERITGHMLRVAGEVEAEGRLTRTEAHTLGRYLSALTTTFKALNYKYLMTGRAEGSPRLTFDRHDSGFPVAQELMVMALDAAQVTKHLGGMASEAELKDRMVRQIVRDLTAPVQLQFALSQRLYYESLAMGGLFWARNDPDCQWIEDVSRNGAERKHFLVHWAVYDTQVNLPVVYLLDVEDSGKKPLPNDDRRWPMLQAHLMAQSIAGLKLLTIAQGVDKDFSGLHPKRLRRITLGPMHSHDFTLQSGPISQVLADANAPDGDDWALVWTVEDLLSDREEEVKDGWFSTAERQVYKLDPINTDSGATRIDRMVILPERPYQVLAELNPPGFRDLRKFVVGDGGRILPAR
ncbi:MAG: hypothetical protein FD162_478 [Rhodobacteraceae bacterium]|uniref:hypothetical protein n=1 Tax=Cypionkella sp. TaxID=2811411 RepID=UPI0013229D16|nr:hypothetical protein [Cypionkella sp.]KAF0175507.1 MAG: hypothetical protein FD162_478 [Paracoccaceae bacterium]MDO8328507.1 hypothetical protein [Cypionkella sp.]